MTFLNLYINIAWYLKNKRTIPYKLLSFPDNRLAWTSCATRRRKRAALPSARGYSATAIDWWKSWWRVCCPRKISPSGRMSERREWNCALNREIRRRPINRATRRIMNRLCSIWFFYDFDTRNWPWSRLQHGYVCSVRSNYSLNIIDAPYCGSMYGKRVYKKVNSNVRLWMDSPLIMDHSV